MSASSRRRLWRSFAGVAVVAAATLSTLALAGSGELAQRIRRPSETPEVPPVPSPAPEPATSEGPDLSRQSQADVDRKNVGGVTGHTGTDAPTMPTATTVKLACVDCHGGRGDVARAAATQPGSTAYDDVKKKAHVQPRLAELAKSAANPRSYVRLAQESADYVRFVNPGDLRAARLACGQSRCHAAEVAQVEKSMMTTGPMLWAAALYNNGSFPLKPPLFGESYTESGEPRRLYTTPPPTLAETVGNGVLPWLEPLPRFEIGQPSNVLRIFERGQQRPLELGVPNVDEAPGRPANRLSARGLGTLNRIDPVWLNLQRTRLFDPALSFPGTHDHPGDYRSSGCTGCHVIYANDRSPVHSAAYAQYGNRGRSEERRVGKESRAATASYSAEKRTWSSVSTRSSGRSRRRWARAAAPLGTTIS